MALQELQTLVNPLKYSVPKITIKLCYISQLPTSVITTTVDVVISACLRHLEESAHALPGSFSTTMANRVVVIHVYLRVNNSFYVFIL